MTLFGQFSKSTVEWKERTFLDLRIYTISSFGTMLVGLVWTCGVNGFFVRAALGFLRIENWWKGQVW